MNTPTDSARQVNDNRHLGQAWISAGFGPELILCHEGDKRPFGNNWETRSWTETQILNCLAHGYNLGLRTRNYVAFDIEDTTYADAILQELQGRHIIGNAPYRFRVGSRSCALIVRLDDPFGREWHKATIIAEDGTRILEVLGKGQQLHIEGQRADKGGVSLTWSEQPVADKLPRLDVDELTELVLFIRDMLVRLGAKLKDGKTPAQITTGAKTGGETAAEDEVKRLLGFIPNDHNFASRDDWVQMGHALYGASCGEQWGKDLWESWSNQQPQKDGEAERVWDTMGPDVRSGVGFLRQKAQELNPYAFAKSDFDDITDLEQGRPNPETNRSRWLAAEVLKAARMEDNSARDNYEPVEDFASFKAKVKKLVKPKPIVPGFAYDGIVHGLIAGPGVGKSLYALHACTSAVLGVLPRDGGSYSRSHQAQAIMLFAEDGEDVVGDRALAVETHHATAGQDTALVFKTFCNKPLELLQIDEKAKRILPVVTRGLHQLCDSLEVILLRERDIGGQAPVVLVFDMMRNASFADENQRPNVDALFRLWKALMAVFKREGGPAIGVVFTHHKTKAATRSDQTGTTSAGSIGIEGNARRITELRMVGELLELKVTKVNDGITGQTEHWKKVSVASQIQGGTETALLVPVSPSDAQAILTGEPDTGAQDLFQMEARVVALHRWASLASAPPISHGKRAPPKGFLSLADALAKLPECAAMDKAGVAALETLAVDWGAFTREGRKQYKGEDCKTVFEPVPNWAAPVKAQASFEPVPDIY